MYSLNIIIIKSLYARRMLRSKKLRIPVFLIFGCSSVIVCYIDRTFTNRGEGTTDRWNKGEPKLSVTAGRARLRNVRLSSLQILFFVPLQFACFLHRTSSSILIGIVIVILIAIVERGQRPVSKIRGLATPGATACKYQQLFVFSEKRRMIGTRPLSSMNSLLRHIILFSFSFSSSFFIFPWRFSTYNIIYAYDGTREHAKIVRVLQYTVANNNIIGTWRVVCYIATSRLNERVTRYSLPMLNTVAIISLI